MLFSAPSACNRNLKNLPGTLSFILVLAFISTANAASDIVYVPNRRRRSTLAGNIIAGIVVGAVLLMTLLCLCIYIIHRRRPSRSRAPLTQTLTTGTYSLAHLGPGLGPTRKEKTLGSTEKKPLFGGKFGSSSGKRRGGESGATDQEQPSYDLGDSDLNSPVVRAPEGPPPLYFYGDRDLAGGAEQPFKYDPPPMFPLGHNSNENGPNSNANACAYPPPPAPPPSVPAAIMPKDRDTYFPGGFEVVSR